MIQHMKTGIGFDLCLQILQKIIFKRHHTPTCSADQMMMTVFGVSVKYMTDLIPDTSIIEMNPVDQLNLIQKLQRTVHGRKPHFRIFILHQLKNVFRRQMLPFMFCQGLQNRKSLSGHFPAFFSELFLEHPLYFFLFYCHPPRPLR